jgi:CheY-like chemotaxis protein
LQQHQAEVDPRQLAQLGHVMAAAAGLLAQINHVIDLSSQDADPGGLEKAAAPEPRPEAAAPTPPPQAGPVAEETPRFQGERVLLAEDDPVNQIVAESLLRDFGLDVDVAADGVEAVRLAAENDYALVLMDIQMPRMDGLAATRAILQTERGRGLPILAFSAFALPEDCQQCSDAGMVGHLSKPVNPDLLHATLARWLQPAAGQTP